MLLLGLTGSVFFSALLYISAESTYLRMQTLPPESDKDRGVLEHREIAFPYAVPGTTLVAEKLSSYEGPFCEDGTDREVVNICALHVKNVGAEEVKNAAILISRADAGLAFYGEHIPPGETVVLLEISAAPYEAGALTACNGNQMISFENNVIDRLAITDQSLGTLIVTNISDQPLCNLCLYYKVWLSPPDVYVGGISYKLELPLLQPGQTAYLYPNHYASGYSKVVSATADR